MRPRRLVPLVGFSWGFTDSGSEVVLYDLALLPEDAWDTHVKLLKESYPFWVFSSTNDG